MKIYQITSSAGVDLGTYEGETAAHAIVAMWHDAGYRHAYVTKNGNACPGHGAPDDMFADDLTVTEVVA